MPDTPGEQERAFEKRPRTVLFCCICDRVVSDWHQHYQADERGSMIEGSAASPERIEVVPKADDVTDNYMVAVSRLKAERDRLAEALTKQTDKWSFDTLIQIGQAILDAQFPASVFTGSSDEAGPKFIVALREALASLEGGNDG